MTAASRVERFAIAIAGAYECKWDELNEDDNFPADWRGSFAVTKQDCRMMAIAAMAVYPKALAEEGLAIRPRHPTAEMQEAAAKLLSCPHCDGFGDDIHQCDIWRAMFDAAPK